MRLRLTRKRMKTAKVINVTHISVSLNYSMKCAIYFRNNRSASQRLDQEFRFPEVYRNRTVH